MAKLSHPKNLSKSDFPDAPDWFTGLYLVSDNERVAQVFNAFDKNISFADNMRCQVVEYKFTHNVENAFLAAYSGKPTAIIPVFAEEGYFIPNVKVSVKQPAKITDTKNQIGLTAYFIGAPSVPVLTRILMFW